jgi:hypothetical protein
MNISRCKNISRSMTAFGSMALLLFAATVSAQQVSPSQTAENGGAAAVQAAPPRCDANCVRENAARAAEACAPRIEAQAPTDFDWITRPNAGIFQQADPSSPADAIVRYRGDSVRFMAADKSWLRVSYECGYDASTKTVSYVHVRSGRLDQPLSQAAAPSTGSSMTQAAATPRNPALPQTAAVAQKPKPRVWEPSPVTIQQQSANTRPH